MKMIIAIIRDQDNDAVSHALIGADFRVTRIASSGGFSAARLEHAHDRCGG